jgi:excisionase family DNA binding protein
MVSQALGVSVTTVKRWVDEGILPAHKTVGGHRKVVVSDVLRLIREKNLPHINLSKLIPHSKVFNLADSKSVVSQLLNALQNIHQDSVADIILHAYDHGFAVEDLADSIITPTLHQFDQLVAADKISLLQKYRAHQVMLASLYPLRQAIHAQKQPGQPIAIGGAPEHDSNAISTLLAKLTLLDNGWNAFN